ncbi:MAG: NAD-dependent epimerase/dehydratase family protein [Lachnospiraceae bacterium]|nr:NAD-dependent epimerase/dehydratase family protein [Lachnospiraceae bacterium]
MKKVVITGSTGFIGSWLAQEMMEQNIEVILLIRDKEKCPFTESEKVTLIEYESPAYHDLTKNQVEIDAFYHLAWGGVAPELKNDCDLQLNNIKLALDMVDYAVKIGAKRFIATGTVAEYAFCENIMDLNAKQTPNDMYGAAKTATHYLLETRARILKIPFIWTVVPSTFGEGRRDNNIITYTIKTLLQGEKPRYGYLQQMWDFLYVKEVARALVLIGEKGVEGTSYGIGSGVFKPLRDYIVAIRDIINPSLELGIGEIPALSDKAFSSCVSIYDLTKDTGFVPQIGFEEGIKRTIEYYRNKQ